MNGNIGVKILHIITRLIVGGAQENTLLTCQGLHQRGHEVTLLTGPSLGPEGSLLPRARLDGYAVLEHPSLVRNPRPFKDATAYFAIRSICRRLRPQVVHTHSSKAGIIARYAAWHEHVPIVVHTIHGLPFHPYQSKAINTAWIMLERAAARRCHAIISVADAMTATALQNGIGKPAQFHTIASGMVTEPFLNPVNSQAVARLKLGIPADRLVLGSIARLQPLKGHDDLLGITPDLLKACPQLHFLWIGDGVFRPRFEQMIAAQGWQDRFTLTGLVPPAHVAELIPAMDILVHPSLREGLPRAVPQALLEGVPVIAYDCDGAREVCVPERTGILVPPGNLADLKTAVLQLAADPDRRTAMGLAGRQMCRRMFNADVMVDKIEALYELLDHARPSA